MFNLLPSNIFHQSLVIEPKYWLWYSKICSWFCLVFHFSFTLVSDCGQQMMKQLKWIKNLVAIIVSNFVHGIEEHLIVAIMSYCNSQHCLAESVKEKVQLWEQGKIIILDNACKHYSALQMYSLIHCNSEKTIKSHGSSFYTLKLFFSLVYNITVKFWK